MPLEPGVRLGPYEIAAQIGAGGMGEVYRATDTNLKRQVAIKVLPQSLAGDPDRLAWFRREAQVLASLNRPHIAARRWSRVVANNRDHGAVHPYDVRQPESITLEGWHHVEKGSGLSSGPC